jgi:hypothetical protein
MRSQQSLHVLLQVTRRQCRAAPSRVLSVDGVDPLSQDTSCVVMT